MDKLRVKQTVVRATKIGIKNDSKRNAKVLSLISFQS